MRMTRRTYRIIFLMMIPVVLVLGFIFLRHWLRLNDLKVLEAQRAQELKALEQGNAQLEQELEYAKTDSFIEQMAREILGWIKPGEHKFVNESDEIQPTSSPTAQP